MTVVVGALASLHPSSAAKIATIFNDLRIRFPPTLRIILGLQQRTLHAARLPEGERIRGDVRCDYAARPDGHIVSHRYAWEDDRPGTDPDVIADRDRRSVRDVRRALRSAIFDGDDAITGTQRMRNGEELHCRADQCILPDADLGSIQENAVDVQERMSADVNDVAILTKESKRQPSA